jgi:outer membrane protein
MKRLLTLAVSALVLVFGTIGAYAADTIGMVDIEKLTRSYNKAQLFNDDMKIKEQELEKMRAEFVKQIREAKTKQPNNPVAVEQLQKGLEEKLNTKINEYRNFSEAQSRALENEMNAAIESVAKSKNLSVILAKQAVFVGGTDITNDVLARLNANTAASK